MTYAPSSIAIKRQALALGFDFCRIIPPATAPHIEFYKKWIAAGCAGDMAYLERNLEKRRRPALLSTDPTVEFRSMLVLGIDYYRFTLPAEILSDPSRGILATYALGGDYHTLIRPRLYELDAFIRRAGGRTTPGKCLVDSGPVLERDWAALAGLGFFGKNCCIIHPSAGSWIFLAVILVPEILEYDPPIPATPSAPGADAVLTGLDPDGNYGTWQIPAALSAQEPPARHRLGSCGRCARCLKACPTGALKNPYFLDATRCISYRTIESRSPIPRELRSLLGNRIFGCDICQEICPWNRNRPPRTPSLPGLQAEPEHIAPSLLAGFKLPDPYWLDPRAFDARFRGTPVERARRSGMLRNVCVALGNWADPESIPALLAALPDTEALGRGHAAWALGQILQKNRSEIVYSALQTRLASESEEWVRQEIRLALGE